VGALLIGAGVTGALFEVGVVESDDVPVGCTRWPPE